MAREKTKGTVTIKAMFFTTEFTEDTEKNLDLGVKSFPLRIL